LITKAQKRKKKARERRVSKKAEGKRDGGRKTFRQGKGGKY